MNSGGKSTGNVSFGFAGVLLFAPLFALPLAFGKIWRGRVPLFGEVPGADFAVLALLAAGAVTMALPVLLALLKQDRGLRQLAAGSALGCLVVLLQQFQFGTNGSALLSAIGGFLLPLAGLLLRRELRRMLPVFLACVFLLSAAVTLRELFSWKTAVGLAGNWNWNWTLLTISAPSLAWLLPRRQWRLFWGGILAAAVAAGQFVLCGDYASRGTLLAGCVAGLVLVFAGFLHRHPGRIRLFAVLTIPLLLVAGSVAYRAARSGYFAERLTGETRLALWQGSVALAESHWLFGIGSDRYEGEIAPFLPESYFDSDFAADRHPHPHNELLFFWCSFGVVGILWWLLLLMAGIRGAVLRRRKDERTLLAVWAWWVLFAHGEIDVLLQMPLSGGVFLILTGVLAGTGAPCGERLSLSRARLAGAAGFALAALTLFGLNIAGGWHCRNGKLALHSGDPETARRELLRSVAIRPTAGGLYALSGVELFDFRNPEGAIEALRGISEELRLSSYSHSSGRMARALAAGGRPEAALPFFAAEQENFPHSAVNLFLWQSVLRHLGRTDEADGKLSSWRELLLRKGITPDEFPWLLRNQLLDDNPSELRNFLEKLRK